MRNLRSHLTERRDHYQELTDKIIAALEAGVAPWRRPWDPNACGGSNMPVNLTTGHRYRGVNLFVLSMSPFALTSGDPRWCSYRQAVARGWQLRVELTSAAVGSVIGLPCDIPNHASYLQSWIAVLKARQHIAAMADLIGAVRLPESAMHDRAGTEVVVDILFLQKRDAGTAPAGAAWDDLAEAVPAEVGETALSINRYFVEHPEMALGTHARTSSAYGPVYMLKPASARFFTLRSKTSRFCHRREPLLGPLFGQDRVRAAFP